MVHLENLYSFRRLSPVFGNLVTPSTPSEAQLAAIEIKLVQAHNEFLGHRYQDAIKSYKLAQSLIHAQIQPGYAAGYQDLVIEPGLFDSILSVGLEYLNALPPKSPPAAVTPRVAADPGLLKHTSEFAATGLSSSVASSPAATAAAADWQAATTLNEAGNARASEFFMNRAMKAAPDLVGLLNAAPPPAAAAHTFVQIDEALQTSIQVGPAAARPLPLPAGATAQRSMAVLLGGQAKTFTWPAGSAPPLDSIKQALYTDRIQVTDLTQLLSPFAHAAQVALELAHDYYYVVPLGLAECYHALADYANAENQYFQAAAYQFLNTSIEAPYLGLRLAQLYLDWGNAQFLAEDTILALAAYQNLLMVDGSVPASRLYATTALKPATDAASTIIANIAALIDGSVTAASLNINPALAATILSVHQQLLKIQGGLDFFGNWHNSVPIWTFDYLQSVAINFAQLAISAEHDFINFQEGADKGSLTRQQLSQGVQQTKAEVQAAAAQATAAHAEAQAYTDGADLANTRAGDASANADAYAASSAQAIMFQALSAQVSGGDDGDAAYLNRGADALLAGHSIQDFDAAASLGASAQLAGLRLTRQYEVDALNRQAAEMAKAQTQADDEARAATARAAAADAATAVAALKSQQATDDLQAFDQQFFTPDVWQRMADATYQLYRRYLTMAVRAARLMQQAYNFETDQALAMIKADYSTDQVHGLLGASTLMADIQGFTYDLITSRAGKPQPLRHTISLAQRYGYAFETQFRKTGAMSFETRMDDFDAYYPGTYAGRIEAVEVEVVGIVPVSGISGTLTNGGISSYRLPASAIAGPGANPVKYRVQSREALVLSDYSARQDLAILQNDQRMLRVMEGAGLASTWELELPMGVNDIDYGALTDVRLTFSYRARYDPDLRTSVLADLASRPGFTTRQRAIPLRWLYPDAFFHFQDTGTLNISLRVHDFPSNQKSPVLTDIGILIATDGSVPPAGLQVDLTTPTAGPVTGVANASGGISSSDAASPWAPLATGTAIGGYTVTLTAANNEALVVNGQFTLKPIVNIGLILGYAFTPKSA
jgi:hypothetical protein